MEKVIYKNRFKEKDVDISNIIGEVIDTDWSKDNESQMKVTQLLKGIATSSDPISNKFMKKLDDFTSGLKKADFKEGVEVKTKSAKKVLQLLDKDWTFKKAVDKIMKDDDISREQLEKELEPFI